MNSKRIYVQKGMATEFFKNFYRKNRWHGQFVKVSQVQNKLKFKRSFEFCISDKRMKKVKYRLEN